MRLTAVIFMVGSLAGGALTACHRALSEAEASGRATDLAPRNPESTERGKGGMFTGGSSTAGMRWTYAPDPAQLPGDPGNPDRPPPGPTGFPAPTGEYPGPIHPL